MSIQNQRNPVEKNEEKVPEAASEEPAILTPQEDAARATQRQAEQEREEKPVWPQPNDPGRQAGESSPAPEKRSS
jgi:hypothetical protein